jgi:hypothetical protein
MLLDAQQDTAGTGLHGGTLRLDIRSARFAHRGDLHERCLARLGKFGEMRLDAFDKPFSSGLRRGATACNVSAARVNDPDVLGQSR